MPEKNDAFSKDELQTLEAFFEQFYQEQRDRYLSKYGVVCKTNEDGTVFTCSWKDSAMGWHDESWRDNATFTIRKDFSGMPEAVEDAENCDSRVQAIAKNAESCCVAENTYQSDWHYDNSVVVLLVKGFLSIPEQLRIEYVSSNGEW